MSEHDVRASDIAVLGMSGRFPGARDAATLWRNLSAGIESISFFAPNEVAPGVDSELLRDPCYVRARGILGGIEGFDAELFGFTPREAVRTDPQQRLFLECAWEALEDAAYDPRRYTGSIGVFAGSGTNRTALARLASAEGDDLETQIGNDADYLSTRVSYKLRLRGPSVNLRTACSTSLVAVHMACQSLLCGECDLALAGGVWVWLPQKTGYRYTPEGICSPDGHCRTFDAQAQGIVPGNGAGVVVLKHLAAALEDGDRIRAVIKGSAINNDGADKVGYTAPSIRGQAAVIREAQAVAGVPPETVTYVETHGTGTALGDSIEIAALSQVFASAAGAEPRPAWRSRPVVVSWPELDFAALRQQITRQEARLEGRVEVGEWMADRELVERLDDLCARHLYRWLNAPLMPPPGARFGRAELARMLPVERRFHRLEDLLLRVLEEDGILSREGEHFRLRRSPEEVGSPGRLEREIVARWPAFEELVDVLRRSAQSYPALLRGEVEVSEVLAPEVRSQFAGERLHLIPPGTVTLCQELLLETATRLAADAQRPLRVLEIGAGSGALAWPLLDALRARGLAHRERLDYRFTDIASPFLERARHRAASEGLDAVRSQRLDLDLDPITQGFEPRGFDLVLGLNSVHTGSMVGRTLANLRSLLAPGGLLAMVEMIRVERWHDLIYGSLPGWWDFHDPELRSHSLFLDLERWHGALTAAGFQDVASFPTQRIAADHALIVARPRPEATRIPSSSAFCALGSVKTNLGHLGAAAGVTGLIKTVLALEDRQLPPSLHFREPNPEIDFGPFFVNAELRPWASGEHPRRAGVSSFGIGGTNAHVVLEEAPKRQHSGSSRSQQVLVLSAKTETALAAMSTRLAEKLRGGGVDLADAAWTLQTGRQVFEHRRAVLCGSLDEAVAAIGDLDPRRVWSGRASDRERSLVFLFPGQGAQRVDMGRVEYDTEPTFRRHVDHCCDLLAPRLGIDLRTVLYPGAADRAMATTEMGRTSRAQAALFVVEYALARLWMEWGVRPRACLGHSLGEYVAACLAEVFSLADALELVATRGRLMEAMPPGAMLAVALPVERLEPLLGEELFLAAINAPARAVVAGTEQAVATLAAELTRRGVEHRRLHTAHAFHSPQTEPILDAFGRALRGVELRAPRIPYVSNLTGTWVTAAEATDPDFWVRHMRSPVRFAEGLGTVLAEDAPMMLEVGPGGTLSALTRQHPRWHSEMPVLSCLPRLEEAPGVPALHANLARLWTLGCPVDWPAYAGDQRRQPIGLPTYPFERRRLWDDSAVGGSTDSPTASAERSPVATPATTDRPAYLPPSGTQELDLAKLWQELLGIAEIGRDDDFFALGGDSLLATSMLRRLARQGVELTLKDLHRAPTLRRLAATTLAATALAADVLAADARPAREKMQEGEI